MVEFNSDSTEIVRTYNETIYWILTNHDLSTFYQIGSDEEGGYHSWVVWKDISRHDIEVLRP